MDVIIVGCGRAGALLASKLARAQHTVTVIDAEPQAFLNLDGDFRGHLVEADALNRDVLADAGIATADALAAMTNADAVNAVVGHVATTAFGVPRVVVRSYDPAWVSMHGAFGLPTVSSVGWGTDRVAELLLEGHAAAVKPLGDGALVLAEVTVATGCDGIALRDVTQSFAGVVAAVVHDGHCALPAAETVLTTGDTLVVSGGHAEVARLQAALGAKEGPCLS